MLNSKHKSLDNLLEEKAATYQGGLPFPHISIDEFIDPDLLNAVLEEFPDLEKKPDQIYYNNPNEDKHATKGDELFGPNTKKLVDYLNSQEFRDFLNKLTGIKEPLLADPHYEGGGFHQIKKGGFLKIHVDFHKHRKLDLHRRLNMLIYLNKDWEESYGGHFELWEKDMSKCAVKILPVFNRMAMFSTTGDSWHGHPDPLSCPDGRSRRSLALYYYTEERPEDEVKGKDRGRVTTTFAERKGIDSKKMTRYNKMVNLANKILPNGLITFLKKFRNK
jgi:hypothetical protein